MKSLLDEALRDAANAREESEALKKSASELTAEREKARSELESVRNELRETLTELGVVVNSNESLVKQVRRCLGRMEELENKCAAMEAMQKELNTWVKY